MGPFTATSPCFILFAFKKMQAVDLNIQQNKEIASSYLSAYGFLPWAITFFAFSEGSDPIRKLKEIRDPGIFTWIYRMDRIME